MSVPVLWVIAGVLCALLEMTMPHMVVIFFAFGAWIAAAMAGLGYNLNWQLGTFIAVSILSLVLLRKHARAFFSGRFKQGEDGGTHPMLGRSGVVSKIITPFEPGEINIGGSYWRATASNPIDFGEQVRVLAALPDDALTLYVEALRPGDTDNPRRK